MAMGGTLKPPCSEITCPSSHHSQFRSVVLREFKFGDFPCEASFAIMRLAKNSPFLGTFIVVTRC